jgi:hypothetical protein
MRPHGLAGSTARGGASLRGRALEFGNLALDEFEAVDLAADLDAEALGQLAAVAGDERAELGQPIGAARIEIIDAHGHEQAADAVQVTGLLPDQALALAAGAPGILGGDVGHADHGAQPALAALPGEEGAQDCLDIDDIRLLAPGAAIDLQRTRVDDIALEAGGREPPVQPEALVTGLVARAYPRRRPSRPGDQSQQPVDIAGRQLVPRRSLRARPEQCHQPSRPAQLNGDIQRRRHRTTLIDSLLVHDTPPGFEKRPW